jgi:hypothetical protein
MKIDMKRLEILGLSMWILEDKSAKKEDARVSRLDPCGHGKELWINLTVLISIQEFFLWTLQINCFCEENISSSRVVYFQIEKFYINYVLKQTRVKATKILRSLIPKHKAYTKGRLALGWQI